MNKMFCAPYIKDYATISTALRELTWRRHIFDWPLDCEKTLKKSKGESVVPPTWPTELNVEASPVGLGAIPTQRRHKEERRIVSYASRSLSDGERSYSQAEKESPAVVWTCEQYHIIIFGKHSGIKTDLQALVCNLRQPRAKCHQELKTGEYV
ncbi:hypothetical protein NDU88_008423 [Pleurodeles waltl]|uniref:Reverse transcriptase RNase H-like domain-containing protein n=1 Tax=Pleurodeles waltl TaxID=8319 RepID=A0AAV7N8B8_PLEWA|nr:hypothetical protein NDU88_008423 [Pleurodeles waltl]